MSDYTKIVDFAAKDALLTGNPSKLVKGTEIGAELDAISTAIATKYDSSDVGYAIQAYDADLTTWAGVTPGTGVATALAVNVGSSGAPVINGGALGTPSSGTLTNATGLPAAGVTGTALVSAAIGSTVQAYDADIPTVAASQVEMEAGTEAALRSMSPLRVAQAIAALAPASASTPTGAVLDYVGSTEPSGWLFLSGLTIGNGSSGATGRANADTSDLFTLLWNSMANSEAAVSTGRGANAAADFAANKTITLPDARGRAIAGKDDMGGSTASRITNAGSGIVGTTLGVAGGSQTHTLTEAQLAGHTHGAGSYAASVRTTEFEGTLASLAAAGLSGTTTISVTGTSGSTGSGTAHQNTQPTLVLNKIIKL